MARSASSSELVEGLGSRRKTQPTVNDNLAVLYAEYRDDVSAYVRRQFGNGPPDPDDITQIAFQKLLENRNSSRIKNFGAYLRRAARNLVLTAMERDRTRERYEYEVEQLFFPSDGYGSGPETVIQCREELETISSALESMTVKRRRAFILHRVEGLSIAETGRQMGISRAAASQHISQALAIIDAAIASGSNE